MWPMPDTMHAKCTAGATSQGSVPAWHIVVWVPVRWSWVAHRGIVLSDMDHCSCTSDINLTKFSEHWLWDCPTKNPVTHNGGQTSTGTPHSAEKTSRMSQSFEKHFRVMFRVFGSVVTHFMLVPAEPRERRWTPEHPCFCAWPPQNRGLRGICTHWLACCEGNQHGRSVEKRHETWLWRWGCRAMHAHTRQLAQEWYVK